MQKSLKSILIAILIPLAVGMAIADFSPTATSSPADAAVTIKQRRRTRTRPRTRPRRTGLRRTGPRRTGPRRTRPRTARRVLSEGYYRDNYDRAIFRGYIRRIRRLLVSDYNDAIESANRAIERRDRNKAALHLTQALVIREEIYGTRAAADLERRLDNEMRERTGQKLRDYLPLFARIFPPQTQNRLLPSLPNDPFPRNSYESNYEQAIRSRIIRRPSAVSSARRAIDLGTSAMDRGNYNEAAIRFAQALVILEKRDGTREASIVENRLDDYMEDEWDRPLRDLPLFERIFPSSLSRYR